METLNRMAESYVKLVLALGEHDPDYVDAYYGPAEWRDAARREKASLDVIRQSGLALVGEIRGIVARDQDPMLRLRRRYLQRQLQALITRVEMLEGRRLRFDEEADALYDAVPPAYAESHFSRVLGDLEALLPGGGSVEQKYERFKREFIIPGDRLDIVFSAAVAEARKRTKLNISLPVGETFRIEFVKDKPWSGYNWYQGNYYSLIQVNTDLPVYIDRAIDLACHEGYPGHHVYNVLLEENLLRKRNWIEFSVYPLFSPQSLVAEGTANYGIEVAFPGPERVEFERKVLFPLAGLDASRVETYDRIAALVEKLNYAGNEAARRYLDGEMTADSAVRWLEVYALMGNDRARQRLRFIDRYRSYVINYNFGLDLVRDYIAARGGTEVQPEKRWKLFAELISSPRLPSGLR